MARARIVRQKRNPHLREEKVKGAYPRVCPSLLSIFARRTAEGGRPHMGSSTWAPFHMASFTLRNAP